MPAAAERSRLAIRNACLCLTIACLLTVCPTLPLLAGYLEDAREEIANNDPRTAIIHLRNALKDDADDVAARSLLGELLLKQGKITAARDHLARAFEAAPSADIATLLGYALLAEGEAETAFLFAERHERGFTDDPGRLPLLKAEALLSLQRLDEAKASLAPYLKNKPLDMEALVIDSRLKLATGDLAAAAGSIARALDVDPASLPVLWTRVDVDRVAGRFDLAHDHVDRLAEQAPGNPEIEVARASIFISAGRLTEAKKRLEAVLGDHPKMPAASLLLANILSAEGDYAGTQRLLEGLDKASKASKPYLLLSGLANAAEHRYAIAETLLSEYVEHAPGDQSTRRLLGNVQLNAGLDSSAITTLKPLADAALFDSLALQLLASAEIRAGRLEDAAKTLRRLADEGLPTVSEQASSLLAVVESDEFGRHRHDVARVLDYMHYGEGNKAKAIISDLATEQPGNVTFLNLLGITRFRSGDEAGAREAFSEILKIDPDHDEAQQALDQIDFRAGNFTDLEKRLRERLEAGEDRERVALALATLLAASAGYQEAYDFLIEEAALQPQSIDLREALVTRGASLGRSPADEPWLDQLMALGDGGATEAYRLLGALADGYGQSELALEAFEKLVQTLPDDPGAAVNLARAHYGLGHLEEAKASAAAAVGIDPAHDVANRILVELAIETGEDDQALQRIESLEADNPVLSQELRALVHVRAGRLDEAFGVLEKGLSTFHHPDLAHALFIYRRQAGRLDDAIEGLRAWLVREPGDAVAMDLLGDVYVESGDLELALRYYEQATLTSADNPILLNDLSWVRHVLGLPGAAETAERAYTMAPLPEIADTLGWILTREGALDDGLPLLREAFGARPDNPTIRYHLAFALAENDKVDEASATLETLVDSEQPFAEQDEALALWEQLTTSP